MSSTGSSVSEAYCRSGSVSWGGISISSLSPIGASHSHDGAALVLVHVRILFLGKFLVRQLAEGIFAGDNAEAPAIVEITVQSADVVHDSDRSSRAALHGVRIVSHAEKHDPRSGGLGFFVSLCLSVQAIPFVHVGYLLVLFRHALFAVVEFHLIENAAIILSGVEHLDGGIREAVRSGLVEGRPKAQSMIAGRPFMIRLILDLGVESVGLHLRHHTGEPDNIGMVLVRRCHKLGSELYMPLEVGEVLDLERLAVFLFC